MTCEPKCHAFGIGCPCSVSAPTPQGLVLFEQYEASGSLLVVTSDASTLRLEPGDVIYRRAWATASEPVEVNRARVTPPGSGDASD